MQISDDQNQDQQQISQQELDKEIDHFKAHLLSVCSALGGIDKRTGVYVAGDEVLDCLKDLKRYLKDEEGQVPVLSLIHRSQGWSFHVCQSGV